MATLTYDAAAPMSSGEIQTIDPQRVADVDNKQRMVAEFLKSHEYQALLLQKAENIAWFTSGAECTRGCSSEPMASVFITPEARVLVASNIDSGQLFDQQLFGLGFQLKERPWHEKRGVLVDDLCRGRSVASDTGRGKTTDVSRMLTHMQVPLNDCECERVRQVGHVVSHAIEATARTLEQGQTEAEIAGEVAHRMLKRQVVPMRLQVWADGQGHRYRHWGFGGDRVERYCVISAIGRRAGLCAAASRTMTFGDVPQTVQTAHRHAMLAQATGLYFSKSGWTLADAWKRVARIYEKYGFPEEWQLADQADVIGYEISAARLTPQSKFKLASQTALHWHPSVGPALVGDTILINAEQGQGGRNFEVLTPMENWPKLKIDVKGVVLHRPDILKREL